MTLLMNDSFPTSAFDRYHGDGRSPAGRAAISFRGEPGRYIADRELATAVNTALAVEQPLLVTGEPGTGKSALAWSVASELGLGEPLMFHTRSDSQARDLLYVFDHLRRYLHAQLGDRTAEDPLPYLSFGALGMAIRADHPRVVLIDEVDKAPRDFANDCLDLLDNMAFSIPETGHTFRAAFWPVVIVTSNNERQLPDPFLRRCVFHHIDFPSSSQLHQILRERLGHLNLSERLCAIGVARFQELRGMTHLEKRPTTAELLTWIRVLIKAGIDAEFIAAQPLGQLPMLGTLIKSAADRTQVQSLRASDQR